MSHPIIEVFNKVDLLSTEMPRLAASHRRVYISALRGDHIERLLDKIAEVLAGGYCRVRLLLPQGRGDLLAIIHREGRIVEQEFRADYVEMTVDLPSKRVEQWKRLGFVISDFVSVV
jgi:GTP-binding protein HflX